MIDSESLILELAFGAFEASEPFESVRHSEYLQNASAARWGRRVGKSLAARL